MKKKTLSAAAALMLALLLAAFLCLPAFAEGEDGLPEAAEAYSGPEAIREEEWKHNKETWIPGARLCLVS